MSATAKEIPLSIREQTQQESTAPAPDADYAPREYSFRMSVSMTLKLLIIGGSVLAFLWALDVLVAP
jgi:hypothetical protein